MRKTKGASHENHERWLVSYADFITLLFAFFVVMFASSQTDKAHARAVSESIEKALKNGSISPGIAAMIKGHQTTKKETSKPPSSEAKPGAAKPQRSVDLANSLEI